MDWAESQDLVEIYLSEVDERADALRRGATLLSEGVPDEQTLDDLIRHAHTIKGSSRMMGRGDVGAAAASLEEAWKAIRSGDLEPSREVSQILTDVAGLVPQAARDDAHNDDLKMAVAPLRQRLSPDETTTVTRLVERPPAEEREPKPAYNPLSDGATLGGLLASIQQELSGSVTRVDTGDLYRLINRAVEIGLDTEALADLTHISFEGVDPARLLAAWRSQLERLSADVAELQRWAVSLANVTFGEAIETFPQFVRFLGRRLDKEVRFESNGLDIPVDRQIVDLLREPLRHLIVNAVDHGVEPSAEREQAGKPVPATIRLSAEVKDERLMITVTDDGRGIDWEAVAEASSARGAGTEPSELRGMLFQYGFTTVENVTDFSGTGEGLALVADAADRVGGSVTIDSRPGGGTTVKLDLPVSLVLQNIVIVAAGDQFFGISEPAVLGSTTLTNASLEAGEDGYDLVYQGERVPVVSFSQALGMPADEDEAEALVLSTRPGLVAVAVAEIVDRRRVAVKSLGPILEGSEHLTGAAFLGGGQVLVVVDHNHLGAQARRPESRHGSRARVLVVDDSAGVRQLISATLRGRGYDVTLAASAREAMAALDRAEFDALVVDYSMPRSNGVELVRALRTAGVQLPIVMVSGVATEDDKAAAWEAGVNAYLDKYDLRQGALTASLSRLLGEAATVQEPS